LDRFDLTILLSSYFEKYKKFEMKREYQTFIKDQLVKKVKKTPVMYSLIVVDEFQNYLPEQLEIMRKCLDSETESVIYVGDIAQQVKLGTIRDWKETKETIEEDRKIKLNKVYRNTKNILSYIKNLDYDIEIPHEVKEGPVVDEVVCATSKEEIEYITGKISNYREGSIGIISKDESWLKDFKIEFDKEKNIHVLSMIESQGVEFDLVFLVGVKKESFVVSHHIDILPIHTEERKRMQKDLLYVALTRAITELHILGRDKLSDVLKP